jgi:hypothetical protein
MFGRLIAFLQEVVGAVRVSPTGVAAVLAMLVSGCVPLPYRPAATVSHAPIKADAAAAITLSSDPKAVMLDSLAKSIRHAEPRVVLVDSRQYLTNVLPRGSGTLSDVLNASRDAAPLLLTADYVLCVGAPSNRRLHDTGAAAPFPYFPVFWVGYEKVQRRASLSASFVDLRDPQAADSLLIASTYSEVIAGLAYGVATVAMPEAALRNALAADVAHTLATAHPTGAIRLVVLAQAGGSAQTDGNSPQGLPAR